MSAESIRKFFRELFRSRYVEHLEAELVRQRMDYDSRLRELLAEKLELNKKIFQLELALVPALRSLSAVPTPPKSTLDYVAPVANWAEALEEHKRQLDREEQVLK